MATVTFIYCVSMAQCRGHKVPLALLAQQYIPVHFPFPQACLFQSLQPFLSGRCPSLGERGCENQRRGRRLHAHPEASLPVACCGKHTTFPPSPIWEYAAFTHKCDSAVRDPHALVLMPHTLRVLRPHPALTLRGRKLYWKDLQAWTQVTGGHPALWPLSPVTQLSHV